MSIAREARPVSSGRARRGFRWWAVRAVAVALLGPALLFTAAYVIEVWTLDRLTARYPAPGVMVNVGDYDLHLYCTGNPAAKPAVIISPGFGSSTPHWHLVQSAIATRAYVCSYDRPGSGWSFVAPASRTYQAEADELRTLLQNGGVEGPFVLVGHSYGGGVMQVFASQFPKEVVGIVLVDSVAPGLAARYPAEHLAAQQRQEEAFPILAYPGVFRLLNWFGQYRTQPMIEALPAEVRRTAYALDYNSRLFKMQQAYRGRGEERERAFLAADPLPAVPLIVITRGIPTGRYPGESEATNLAAEAVWQDGQLQLSRATADGVLIVAENSGHNIITDQPVLVTDAIVAAVEQARRDGR